MAGLEIPELASVQFQRLAIQEANLRLQQRQQKEQEDDRWFRGQLGVLNAGDMPVEARMQAGNAILERMGMPMRLTEELLNPFAGVMKRYTDLTKSGGDTSILQPQIEYLLAKGAVPAASIPQAVGTLGQIERQQAEQTTALALKPELDQLTTSRNWMNENAERVKQAQARLQPGAAVQIAGEQMSHEDATGLIQQAQRHQAVLDRERILDDKKTFFHRAFQNPALRKAFETGRAAEALGLPLDENALRARAIQLEVDGPQDAREERLLEVLRPFAFKEGQRLAELRLNEQIQRNQRQAQTAKIAQALVTQNAHITRLSELEHRLEATRAKRKAGNLTPDELAQITAEEGELNTAIGDAQQASFRDAESAGEQFQAVYEDVQTQLEATRTQLARVPIAQTVALKQDIRNLEADAKFYDNLMTKLLVNHPTKQAELRQQAYLMEQDGQTKEAAQLRGRVETMAREWGALSDQVQAHTQAVTARGSQLNSAMARLNKDREKEEATNSLVKYAVAHKGEGLTAAFQNGISIYPAADTTKAYDTIRKIVEDEGNLKLWDAQAAFAARREQNGATETVEQSLAHIGRNFKGVDLKKVRESVEKSPLVSVDMGSKTSVEEYLKSSRATFDQLKAAPVLLMNIDRAKALIPQARGFMGPGGETLLEAAKFLNNRLGSSINIQGIKSAEELRSRIFFNIMDNLKKMDAQPSQMQQQIMMDALGKLGTDPNALADVLDAYAQTIREKVEFYNLEVRGAVERGTKFPYNPIISLPQASGPREGFSITPSGQGSLRRIK